MKGLRLIWARTTHKKWKIHLISCATIHVAIVRSYERNPTDEISWKETKTSWVVIMTRGGIADQG